MHIFKATAAFGLLILYLHGCASNSSVKKELNTPLRKSVVRSGLMLKRMGTNPSLKMLTDQNFLISSPLAAITLKAKGNKTTLFLKSKGKVNADILFSFIKQTSLNTPLFTPKDMKTRSLAGLFGLHLLSPSFSSLYAGYQNPFGGKKNIWLRFLLHLGVDALGTTAASTEGFRKGFRVNTGTIAFLLLHRVITLPSMVIETDLYNRSLRAGYKLRF